MLSYKKIFDVSPVNKHQKLLFAQRLLSVVSVVTMVVTTLIVPTTIQTDAGVVCPVGYTWSGSDCEIRIPSTQSQECQAGGEFNTATNLCRYQISNPLIFTECPVLQGEVGQSAVVYSNGNSWSTTPNGGTSREICYYQNANPGIYVDRSCGSINGDRFEYYNIPNYGVVCGDGPGQGGLAGGLFSGSLIIEKFFLDEYYQPPIQSSTCTLPYQLDVVQNNCYIRADVLGYEVDNASIQQGSCNDTVVEQGEEFDCPIQLIGSPNGVYFLPANGIQASVLNINGDINSNQGASDNCTIQGNLLLCNRVPTGQADSGVKQVIVYQPNVEVYSGNSSVLITPRDTDGDGIPDEIECPNIDNCLDSDGDDIPDYRDTDSDNDGILDSLEKGTNCPTTSNCVPRDSDRDGLPDYRDADDDNDGIPTRREDLNNNSNWFDDDPNNNGIPSYLEAGDEIDLTLSDLTSLQIVCGDSGQGIVVNSLTDCRFDLPIGKRLPQEFQLGIGTSSPTGECTLSDPINRLVICTNVPTGSQSGVESIFASTNNSPKADTNSDAQVSIVCSAGTYLNAGNCVVCEKGYYCNNSQKFACPQGLTTAGTGASLRTQCISTTSQELVRTGGETFTSIRFASLLLVTIITISGTVSTLVRQNQEEE